MVSAPPAKQVRIDTQCSTYLALRYPRLGRQPYRFALVFI
jgi:hypothetical protein